MKVFRTLTIIFLIQCVRIPGGDILYKIISKRRQNNQTIPIFLIHSFRERSVRRYNTHSDLQTGMQTDIHTAQYYVCIRT